MRRHFCHFLVERNLVEICILAIVGYSVRLNTEENLTIVSLPTSHAQVPQLIAVKVPINVFSDNAVTLFLTEAIAILLASVVQSEVVDKIACSRAFSLRVAILLHWRYGRVAGDFEVSD